MISIYGYYGQSHGKGKKYGYPVFLRLSNGKISEGGGRSGECPTPIIPNLQYTQ